MPSVADYDSSCSATTTPWSPRTYCRVPALGRRCDVRLLASRTRRPDHAGRQSPVSASLDIRRFRRSGQRARAGLRSQRCRTTDRELISCGPARRLSLRRSPSITTRAGFPHRRPGPEECAARGERPRSPRQAPTAYGPAREHPDAASRRWSWRSQSLPH